MTNALRGTAAAVLALGLAASASAHDTWLAPVSAGVPPGTTLRLSLTSGGAFPALESPIDPRRVARAQVRVGGRVVKIPKLRRGPRALELSVALETPGIALFAVSLAPRALTLTPSQIQEYLGEIGAEATAGALWEKVPAPKTWRETYTKHATTFARVSGGGPPADASWKEPAGLDLEIVPERDPTSLAAGDSFSVRVLRRGAPLAGLPLRADPGPEGKPQRRETDAEGRAVFTLDRPGRWLLAGTDLRLEPDGKSWRSDFSTLTLEVAPAR